MRTWSKKTRMTINCDDFDDENDDEGHHDCPHQPQPKVKEKEKPSHGGGKKNDGDDENDHEQPMTIHEKGQAKKMMMKKLMLMLMIMRRRKMKQMKRILQQLPAHRSNLCIRSRWRVEESAVCLVMMMTRRRMTESPICRK